MRFLMMMAVAGLTLSACATMKPIPSARKLNTEVMEKVANMDVVIVQNEDGVRASWASAAGGAAEAANYYYVTPGTSPLAAGVGAGLGAAIGAAIVDAAPSARARRSVNSINLGIEKEKLDAGLIEKIKDAQSGGVVKIAEISTQTFSRKDPDPVAKLKIAPTYTLSEDASAVRVSANVTYAHDDLTYQTPYNFEGKTPKDELRGPLFRNYYSYHSDRFIAPDVTDESKVALVEAIESQYAEEIAELVEGEDNEKARAKIDKNREKALKNAGDDKFSKTELATLLIGKWRGDGVSVLEAVISEGQTFLADMIVADLNDASVPQFERKEELPKVKTSLWVGQPIIVGPIGNSEFTVIAKAPDGRTTVRIDSGMSAGAIISYPENGFATYGNTYKTVK